MDNITEELERHGIDPDRTPVDTVINGQGAWIIAALFEREEDDES